VSCLILLAFCRYLHCGVSSSHPLPLCGCCFRIAAAPVSAPFDSFDWILLTSLLCCGVVDAKDRERQTQPHKNHPEPRYTTHRNKRILRSFAPSPGRKEAHHIRPQHATAQLKVSTLHPAPPSHPHCAASFQRSDNHEEKSTGREHTVLGRRNRRALVW